MYSYLYQSPITARIFIFNLNKLIMNHYSNNWFDNICTKLCRRTYYSIELSSALTGIIFTSYYFPLLDPMFPDLIWYILLHSPTYSACKLAHFNVCVASTNLKNQDQYSTWFLSVTLNRYFTLHQVYFKRVFCNNKS